MKEIPTICPQKLNNFYIKTLEHLTNNPRTFFYFSIFYVQMHQVNIAHTKKK